MKNNHMRIVLCLFMCCALLFTCVARPASATSVAVVAGLAAIPVAVAAACAFQALGVMSASNSTDFTTAVNNCSNWLAENSSFVVNGTVALLGLTNAGLKTSYLSKNFIQSVWEWLYDSETVTYGPAGSTTFSWTVNGTPWSFVWDSRAVPFYVQQSNGKLAAYYCFGSTYAKGVKYWGSSILVDNERPTWNSAVGAYFYYDTLYSPGEGPSFPIYGDNTNAAFAVAAAQFGSYQVKSNHDLTLGLSESPFLDVGTEEETIQIEIAPIYIDWTKYGVPDPNNPETPPEDDPAYRHWLPTGIPSPEYDDSVIKQNQQQAQSGVVSGDISFEPYQPDGPGSGGGGTGTDLSSVIQTIINVPTAIVSGIGNFISDFFGFNGKYEDYTVQLRDFFPFCIPFDLYDFITVLSAEPEAPVFHWEIPVPQLGQTFELEVDLSAWDDIALLFRNLELLAFIFGLAVMTREKFLRS